MSPLLWFVAGVISTMVVEGVGFFLFVRLIASGDK